MSWMDKVKNGAKMFLFPGDKPKTVISNLSVYPNPKDLNENQIADMLEQKRVRQQNPNPKKSYFDPTRDISKDKNGHYVSTITYPLPPVSWEKKQFDRNRRSRNSKNNYI